MRTQSHFVILAMTIACTLGLTAQFAHTQDRLYPSPQPPKPIPVRIAGTVKTPVQIRFVVLETTQGKMEEVASKFKEFFPKVDTSSSFYQLGKISTDAEDRLVRVLSDSQLVQVLSRPKVITPSGSAANVQVGQVVQLPSKNDSGENETSDVGLTLKCLPKVVDGGIEMELDVKYRTVDPDQHVTVDGNDYPVFNEQQISSRLHAKDQETFVFQSPHKGRSLLILVHPTIHPPTVAVATPLPRQPGVARANYALGSHPKYDRRLAKDPRQASPSKTKASPQLSQLQSTLDELFPAEKIQLRQLNQSVLLRGTVSEKAMLVIIRVAEDFFPNVVNDLTIVQPPKQNSVYQNSVYGSVTPPKPATLVDEVRHLRNEVQSLRADVHKVIELLKKNETDDDSARVAPAKNESATTAGETDLSRSEWGLTLSEVLSIARQNADPKRIEKEDARRSYEESIRSYFAQLQKYHAELSAMKAEAEPIQAIYGRGAYQVGGVESDQQNAGFTVIPPLGTRRTLAKQKNLELQIAAAEQLLREKMRIAKTDGRKIVPIDDSK